MLQIVFFQYINVSNLFCPFLLFMFHSLFEEGLLVKKCLGFFLKSRSVNTHEFFGKILSFKSFPAGIVKSRDDRFHLLLPWGDRFELFLEKFGEICKGSQMCLVRDSNAIDV